METDFKTTILEPGKALMINGDLVLQLHPDEVFVYPEGSIDDKPSFAFLMSHPDRPEKFIAQISADTLREAVLAAYPELIST